MGCRTQLNAQVSEWIANPVGWAVGWKLTDQIITVSCRVAPFNTSPQCIILSKPSSGARISAQPSIGRILISEHPWLADTNAQSFACNDISEQHGIFGTILCAWTSQYAYTISSGIVSKVRRGANCLTSLIGRGRRVVICVSVDSTVVNAGLCDRIGK